MIYISTGGFNQKSVIEVIKLLSKNNINAFELSGGIYTDNLESKLKILSSEFEFTVHNYFPPPQKPFVLNLASLNENIYQESLNHIKKSIKLASLINSPFYSFHAGFLIDPKVKELGKTIKSNNLYDRDKCLERFIYSIKLLSKYASRYQIKLLVENNVITKSNLTKFESNPLLMTDIKSTREIIKNFDDNLFFLVDVAHLKVSANTLNFDACEYLEVFKNKIGGYHLSDNNGLVDSNKEISDSSWFWPYLRNDLNYYTLEVYDHNPNVLLSQLELAKNKIYR
jgi:sugar phosphate isomerase/epimerase